VKGLPHHSNACVRKYPNAQIIGIPIYVRHQQDYYRQVIEVRMFQRIDLVLRAGDIHSKKMIQDLMNEYASDQKDKDYEKY
jgi:hypothetical protein